MVNLSPPTISLSGADDTNPVFARAASSHLARMVSPAASFGDPFHREAAVASPHESSLLEPQALSLQGDIASLLSDFLPDQDVHSGAFAAGDSAQLSLLLLSAHSAAAVCPGSSGRRVRSGSLFSTNSIWNDDNLPSHSPDRSVSSGGGGALDFFAEQSLSGASGSSKQSSSSFLSPTAVPQPPPFGSVNQARNRSHTTSGLTNGGGAQKMDAFRSNIPPLLHFSQDDPSCNTDNPYLHAMEFLALGTRNRSQTYSGAHPKISQAGLPNMVPGVLLQSSQSIAHNMLEHQNRAMQQGMQHEQPLTESSLVFANQHAEPLLQNDFNFHELLIITDFENPSLGPTNTLLLDNVSQFFDASKLYQLLSNPTGTFSGFGNRGVLSVQVTLASNSKMALVVCRSVEVAMNLKAYFNHLEIIPGAILYVAFVKVMKRSKPVTPGVLPIVPSQISPPKVYYKADALALACKESSESESRKAFAALQLDVEFGAIADTVYATCVLLSGADTVDFKKISLMINTAVKFPKSTYRSSFGSLPGPASTRKFDSPKIRELRKSLEANEKALLGQPPSASEGEPKALSQSEIEGLALAMLGELPELCYDHIGNTIVQKLFTVLDSSEIKLKMVKKILPYLAPLGIHKNGTWAIQKIINLSQREPKQKVLIAESLRPFAAKLFNDQFGNYVLQCCLKFESPYNDFIFETICNNFVEISSGRFGVRCLRTILETLNDFKADATCLVSREQLVLVAGLIVQYATLLVINSNGSLLLTWFLDTFRGLNDSALDQRANLLAEQFLPELEKLCTHKLANLTIFKLLSSTEDANVRQSFMDAIFLPYNESEHDKLALPSKVLLMILKESSENNTGPLFIQKVISSPALFAIGDEQDNQMYQQYAVHQVKKVLLGLHITNLQPYKKLFDEAGLSNSRLGRATLNTRKLKRSFINSRNGHNNLSYHNNLPSYSSQMPAAHQVSMPIGYGSSGEDNYMLYGPYSQGQAYPAGQMNGGQASFRGPYFDKNGPSAGLSEACQDVHVMRQLEQLSLQSTATGYSSNPGTSRGGVGANQGLFL